MKPRADVTDTETSTIRSEVAPQAIPLWLARRLGEHMSEVVTGAAITFVMKMLGAGLMFAFNVAVARLLGVEGAGAFFIALTVLQIGAIASRWGLDNASLRFVASNASLDRWGEVSDVYRKAASITALFSVATGLTVYFTAPYIAADILRKPGIVGSLQVAAIGIPAVALLWIHSEALKGLKRISASQMLQSIVLPISAFAMLAVSGSRWGPVGAVAAYAIGGYVAVLTGALFWLRYTRSRTRLPSGSIRISYLLRAARPLGAIAVTNMVMQWLPLLAVGAFGSKAEAGILGVALRISALAGIVLVAINSVAAPKFAALWAKNDRRALESTAVRSAALAALAGLVVLAMLTLYPRVILGLFGEGFERGAIALAILGAGQFVNAATGSVGFLLMMTGNERYLWQAVTIGAVLCVAITMLIPLGNPIIVASLAVASAVAGQNVVATVYAKRYIGIIPCDYRLLLQ